MERSQIHDQNRSVEINALKCMSNTMVTEFKRTLKWKSNYLIK